MKKINIVVVFLLTIYIGKAQNQQTESNKEAQISSGFSFFGDQIDANGVVTTDEMSKKYLEMIVKDTVQAKFKATVTSVCQAKGCWMKLQLSDGEQAMVRFKDYGFFMPMDIVGKEVIVNGVAFVEEMSIDDQKHYAKDAGKSKEKIAEITAPKKTFGFEADGVLLKK